MDKERGVQFDDVVSLEHFNGVVGKPDPPTRRLARKSGTEIIIDKMTKIPSICPGQNGKLKLNVIRRTVLEKY